MSHAGITDSRGLSLTADSLSDVARYDAIIDDTYYYRLGTADRLNALLEEAPGMTLAYVLKGYSHMSDGMTGAHAQAQERLRQSEALPANRRERLHQEALRAWIAQDAAARGAAWEAILVEWPLDLLALRQYTGALFWTGDKRHQAEVSASVASHWGPEVAGYGHFLTSHAFAMEEVGQYAIAEHCEREALKIQPQDLWALHGLAHVFEMQGRIDEGIEVLTGASRFLGDYNLFRGHLWWHLGLYKLSQGRFDEVLDLFDREIYPQPSSFYLDIQNGVSMLVRLECQGVDVGLARWERLAQAALSSATQSTVWFTAMHSVIALARTGRKSATQTVLDYLGAVGTAGSQPALAQELSLAAVAFCQGKQDQALNAMLKARQRVGGLGASYAQQDLYYQMMTTSALQLGDFPRVRQLLKARLATRVSNKDSSTIIDHRALATDQLEDVESIRAALRWATVPSN